MAVFLIPQTPLKMSDGNSNGSDAKVWLVVIASVAALFVAQAIINAVTMLVNAVVNLLYVAGAVAAMAGVFYCVYHFLIKPNTLNGRRQQELDALLHHEKTLTIISQCSVFERNILISPHMLESDKQLLRLKVNELKADIQNKSIPMIELELKLKQLEILMGSRFKKPGSNNDYVDFEEYKG